MEFIIDSSSYKLELRDERGDRAMLFDAVCGRKFIDFTVNVRGFKVEFVCKETNCAGITFCRGDKPRIRIQITSKPSYFVDATTQGYIDYWSPYPGLTLEKLHDIVREAMRYVEPYLELED